MLFGGRRKSALLALVLATLADSARIVTCVLRNEGPPVRYCSTYGLSTPMQTLPVNSI